MTFAGLEDDDDDDEDLDLDGDGEKVWTLLVEFKFFVRSICIRQITMFCCYLLILANYGK